MRFSADREIAPYSPLRAEVALDPLLREAMGAVIQLGGSPIQASWAMIGWSIDALVQRGADPALLAADLRQVAELALARKNAA